MAVRKPIREQEQAQAPEPRPLWTFEHVAYVLNISIDMVRKLAREKGLPVVYLGSDPKVRPESLDRWLTQQEQGGGL